MNIAFVTPKMIIGGAEQYIITKSKYLQNGGHKIIVISSGGENVDNLPKVVTHFYLNVNDAPYCLPYRDRNYIIKKLANIFETEGIDVVEAHNTFSIYYAFMASYFSKVPVFYNLLNELSHNTPVIVNSIVKLFDKNGKYFTLTSTMNQYVEKRVHKKLSPTIIPIPVEPLPLIDVIDNNFILTVCRFSNDKSYLFHLIEGFRDAALNRLIPYDVKLKIVGNGELYSDVLNFVSRSNNLLNDERIKLLGYVTGPELFKLYSSCTVYVGMGTTILQAAQYKKPIIKVGNENDTNRFAWGFWGNKISDKDQIVAVNESLKDKILYNDIIVQCFNNKNKLVEMGEKSFSIYYNYYNIEKVMRVWNASYLKLQNSRILCTPFYFYMYAYYTFLLRGVYKSISFLKSNFVR